MISASDAVKKIFTGMVVFLAIVCVHQAHGDEALSLYGLKGYGFVFSPDISNGAHVQASVMHSRFNDRIEDRDGFITVAPISLTYGSEDFWEVSLTADWEYWRNTKFEVSEQGLGDVFFGGKVRLLGRDKDSPLDLSLMPYILIPGGNHDKGIGDLYTFNPSAENDLSYGLNFLLGRQIGRFYLAGNLGINFLDTNEDYLKGNAFFAGIALEYHISENIMAYAEFFNTENKYDLKCDPCYTSDENDDMRELGAGLVWIKQRWGFRVHAGTGLTDTTPHVRLMASVNRGF